MYAGHSAVALALRGRNPEVAFFPLVLACYGPDWVDMVLMVVSSYRSAEVYSHSIPAVLIGALMAAGLMAVFDLRGAGTVLMGWLLHWPADLLTGLKPLVGPVPLVGLDLYRVPLADFVMEAVLVCAGAAIYLRAFPVTRRRTALVVATAAILIVSQAAVDLLISRTDGSRWSPSLAVAR